MAKSKIIKELANNKISLEVALNRLYVIASDINNEELQQWAECELHGYGKNKLPEYRYAKNTVFKMSGIQCYSIKQIVPINIFEGIANTLKMLLMKIFIKLDKTYGCLDDLDIDIETIDEQVVENTNAVINNYIYEDNSINIGDGNKIVDSSLK